MLEISNYAEKYNGFTRQLLQNFYKKNNCNNLLISPFSVLMLLAIAADATAGETRDEILSVLSDEPNLDKIISLLCKIQAELTESQALSSSNAVCVNHSIEDTITPDYPGFLQAQFNGEFFSSKDIVSAVNTWVKKATHGLIDEVADDNMREMLACLINATVFKGKWTKHYTRDDIEYKEFTNADETKKEVPMIKDSEDEYVETESFTGFVKPYKRIGYSFMALLPKKKSTAAMNTTIKKLDFTKVFADRMHEKVYISLPEFNYSFDEDLTNFCKSIGINKIFSNQADFSPLSSAWLKMDSIVHKARIEVDRAGTKAAAVTMGIDYMGSALLFEPKIVELNRPFVYTIMHKGTGLPIFTGIVNKL